ncbi:MAG: hypothetical protein WCI31_05665 [Prolixibacteraceae bacterium]
MKQLILLMLVTGMVATSALAQTAVTGSAPQPTTCTNDPLHPIAGKPYDYSAILNPTGGTTFWYATKSTTFVTAGVRSATEILADGTTIMSGATNYRTLGSGAASPTTTNVTWTSAGLKGVDATTNPLFMVLEYKGPTCANNMKVYQILPKNAFTVDILNIKNNGLTPLAYGTNDTQCYADIASAKFVSPNMVYDYGVNKMYFEVVAANFTKAFTPSFKLSGLKTGQSALVEWTVDKTFASGLSALGTAQNATTGTPLSFAGAAVNTNVANTTLGVSVYIRVTITNGLYEGLTDDNITMAVEAVNDSGDPDIDNATCAAPASTYEDIATQTLNLRPTVTSDPATGAFVVQTLP